MIDHHLGGVAMAEAALALDVPEEVRVLARSIVVSQQAEIEVFRQLLTERDGAVGSGAESAPPVPPEPVVAAVCQVAALARGGDATAAKAAFLDDAHEPLHELARELTDQGDRGAAGALLEAKNVIEGAPEGPSTVAAENLVAATRQAVAATGRPDPTPCP
jgi:hypothetical protein